jgi:hypothetical protein
MNEDSVGFGMSQSENTQRLLIRTVIDCVLAGEYKKMSTVLEALIMSIPNGDELYDELARIKSSTSIEFNRFESFYKMSFSVGPRRCINFQDIGKVPFSVIRVLFEEEAVKPLTSLAVRTLSIVSVDESIFLKKLIESKSAGTDVLRERTVRMDLKND